MPKTTTQSDEDVASDEAADELDPSDEELEEGELEADEWESDEDDLGDDEDDEDSEGSDDEEALDELEAEELEMLTEDEASETLVVNEAAEMRAIRRAEIALANSGDERGDDEFLCQNCFLLKPPSQLANKRRQLCNDCA